MSSEINTDFFERVTAELKDKQPYFVLEWFDYFGVWEYTIYVTKPKISISAIGNGKTIEESLQDLMKDYNA